LLLIRGSAESELSRSRDAGTIPLPSFSTTNQKEIIILPLAFGGARYAPVAGEDLGRAIATILNNPAEHAGKSYPLYGARELSDYEVAEILTEVLERK
jgi:uncharacterized protein YbjT (DUF2867 family)